MHYVNWKLRFKSDISKSSNESIFHKLFYNVFITFCFSSHIWKYLKIYQLNIIKKIKKPQNKAHERYRNLSKEEKEKSDNMVMNATKIYQKMRNNVEKNIMEWEKMLYYNYKKFWQILLFYKKKYKTFLIFRLWKIIPWNIRNFLRVCFCYFLRLEVLSWTMRIFLKFMFPEV